MSDDFDIPRIFHSDYTSQPFDACDDCGIELRSGLLHIIQKAIVAGETVFELALCVRCVSRLNEEYSEQSREAIQQFINEQAPGAQTPDEAQGVWPVLLDDDQDPLSNLERCGFCDKPRLECRRYCIAGIFAAGQGALTAMTGPLDFPLTICDDCNIRMNDRVSQQTRDRWNRFVEEHFDGPPGIDLDSPQPELLLM